MPGGHRPVMSQVTAVDERFGTHRVRLSDLCKDRHLRVNNRPGYWYWILESKARLMYQGKMKEGLETMLVSGYNAT